MHQPFTPIVIVDTVIAGEAIATKHKLEEVIDSSNRSQFDIAELLLKIKRKGYYTPYTTFSDYCSSLKLKRTKSYYLTRMASVMEEVGIPRSQYEPLGITRLRDIISLEPTEIFTNPITGIKTPMREFIVGFVEYREANGDYINPERLKQNVRTLKGLVGENDFVWLHLHLQRSAFENVARPALELAKAHIGSVRKDDEGISEDASDSSAAVAIFADYLADPGNDFSNLTYDPNVVEVDELLALQAEAEKDENETIPEVTI